MMAIDIGTSDDALIQMDDAQTTPETASTVAEPLWQKNRFSVRVIRRLAYLRAQTGAVSYMVTMY